MESFEGVLAIGGFWFFMILIVMKKPFIAWLEKQKTLPNQEVEALSQRVQQLENVIGTLTKDMLDMRDTTEFAQKLLTDSSQQVSSLSKRLSQEGVLEAATGGSGKVSAVARNDKADAGKIKLVTADDALLTEMGTILHEHAFRFERRLPASPEKVWSYLTDPKLVKQWLAEGTIEARIGGRVELKFDLEEMPERKDKGATIRGLVGWCAPNTGITYSWIDDTTGVESVVGFTLAPLGDETVLTITHSHVPKNRMHEFMAAWHTHLDILKARLANLPPPEFRKRFSQLIAIYASVVIAFFVAGNPARASGMSSGQSPGTVAYQSIQYERNQLLKKYDQLRRDTDDLQRRVDTLKRDNTQEASKAADDLDSRLQSEFRDLHQLELQIRDLDTAML